jgi:multidrug resistance efflux pump
MNTNRNPRLFILLVFLVVGILGFGYWYFFMRPGALAASGALTASGTVETTEISIAPELSGKISEVDVQEGDTVKTGQVLFKLDDTMLKAQRAVAAAGVDSAKGAAATADAAAASAQAQYDIAFNAALTQNKAPARTAGWTTDAPAEFNLPDWYFSQSEQIAAVQAQVNAAKASLTDAQAKLVSVQGKVSSADFVKAEADLALAQVSFTVANNLNMRVKNSKNVDDLTKRQLFLLSRNAANVARGRDAKWALPLTMDQDLRDAAQQIYDDAKKALDDAQAAYDDALTTKGADDVMQARADVSIAQELYYTSLDYMRSFQTGVDSSSVTAAQKMLDQAQSAAAQAKMAVNQAQANLDLVDAQIAKTTILAPVDGVILTRAAEPGSVVNAGGVMMTLGRLDDLTITVYVPEDLLAKVKTGQTAQVTVDSSNDVFNAVVTSIANQAEFTPRNVQTVEGRKNTVFAVKLTLDNNDSGDLKPGMPADVVFSQK